MPSSSSSYAAGVKRWYAVRRFCLGVCTLSALTTGSLLYHFYTETHKAFPSPLHHTARLVCEPPHFGSSFSFALAFSVLTALLAAAVANSAARRARRHWDHAMVTNLANNLGDSLPRSKRERIAAMIISTNK